MVISPLPKDEDTQRLIKLAEDGDPCAQFELAVKYKLRNDFSSARSWLLTLMTMHEELDSAQWEIIRDMAQRCYYDPESDFFLAIPEDHGREDYRRINLYFKAIADSPSPKQAILIYEELRLEEENRKKAEKLNNIKRFLPNVLNLCRDLFRRD